jgi:catechol 2,3-dioxygenase
MDDPDGNGVELYWDKPREQWPVEADGSLTMYTRALNVRDLLHEAEKEPAH